MTPLVVAVLLLVGLMIALAWRTLRATAVGASAPPPPAGAYLTRELESARRQQAVIADLGRLVFAESPLESVLARAVEGTAAALRTDFVSILEREADAGTFRLRAGHGWGKAPERAHIPTGRGSHAACTWQANEPLFFADAHRESRFDAAALQRHGIGSGVGVRMPGGQHAFGVLAVYTRERRVFAEREIRFVEAVGNAIAAAADRERSGSAHRRAGRQLDAVLNGFPVVLWTWDADGVFTSSMGRGLERLGLTPDEVVGRSVFDVYGAFPSAIDSARRALAGETFDAIIDVGDLCWHARFEPMQDGDGRGAGVLGVALDLTELRAAEVAALRDNDARNTERRRAETEVRRSQIRLRTILDAALDAIVTTDQHGRITDWNRSAERLFGWSAAEAIGRPMVDTIVPESYREALRRRFNRFLNTGETRIVDRRLELEGLRRDGTTVPVELTVTAAHLDCDVMLAGFIRDLSERKAGEAQRQALEAQLTQSQKMEAVGRLSGGIAHDFNNILTVILANAEMAATELSTRDGATAVELAEIRRAARRGSSLVKKLLTFSRREKLETELIDLADLGRDVSRMLRRMLPASIEIEFQAAAVPAVLADSGAVEQIVMNLATNARDAMPEGGVLRLEVAPASIGASNPFRPPDAAPGRFVRLRVSDTGHGMDETTRSRIFEPFFTTKSAGNGTGLGMAMVYGQVRQHGGLIRIDSTRGAGSTIDLYFPARPERAAPARDAVDVMPDLPGGSETILLAEDEEVVRRTTRRILTRLGYTVLEAQDGSEALELLRRENGRIDLVLADMVMPRIGGPELRRLAGPHWPDARFLFLTGHAPDELPRSVAAGECMLKPWTAGDLAVMIRRVLEGD